MTHKLTTVRQRMAVYQAALKLYEKGRIRISICYVIERLTKVKVYYDLKSYCPELWEQRPLTVKFTWEMWWEPTRSNAPLRISALKAAIRECERKLKSKK